MCGLCGALGGSDHWADAAARVGVFNPAEAPVLRRRERARRVDAANRVLALQGLVLADWQGSAYVLSTRTGKTEIVADLGHLWAAAETLSGQACDPLSSELLDRLERSDG
jgi:hypothetical protein